MVLGTIGILIIGIALLSPGHSWEIAHDGLHNHSKEHFNYIDTIINIIGSIILMVGHWMNIKIHRNTKTADDCCHHHP